MINKSQFGKRRRFLLLGHNFLSTDVMSIKMCFWVELHMFFVLLDLILEHEYYILCTYRPLKKGVRHSPTFPYLKLDIVS